MNGKKDGGKPKRAGLCRGLIIEIRVARGGAVDHLTEGAPLGVAVDHPKIGPFGNRLVLEVRAEMVLWNAVILITPLNAGPIIGEHRGIIVTVAGVIECGAGGEDAFGERSDRDTWNRLPQITRGRGLTESFVGVGGEVTGVGGRESKGLGVSLNPIGILGGELCIWIGVRSVDEGPQGLSAAGDSAIGDGAKPVNRAKFGLGARVIPSNGR